MSGGTDRTKVRSKLLDGFRHTRAAQSASLGQQDQDHIWKFPLIAIRMSHFISLSISVLCFTSVDITWPCSISDNKKLGNKLWEQANCWKEVRPGHQPPSSSKPLEIQQLISQDTHRHQVVSCSFVCNSVFREDRIDYLEYR